jgi:alkanesulfonate monooxygenase
MPVEFIGFVRGNDVAEIDRADSAVEERIDPAFVTAHARAHEAAGFDKVLIGAYSTGPDGWSVAAHAAAHTERLGMLVAHRPGFMAPTLAARAAITQDHLSNGRIALNIVTGGSDADLARDGDATDKEARYRRTDEYLSILRRVWTEPAPFDHDGAFYRIRGAWSDAKPLQPGGLPIYFGGASGPAVAVAAQHADVYMLWGEPRAAVRERIAAVRAAAAPERSLDLRFSLSVRPILGATEEEAWATARDYLERIVALRGGQQMSETTRPGAEGARRLLAFAAEGEIHDECLWTPIAAATGAGGNTTALVGTPEQVAVALLAYVDLGISSILIRGFRPLADAHEFGRELIPLVRTEVARWERVGVDGGRARPV